MNPRIVFITHPQEGARDFARLLIERRVAACCNLGAVTSVYRWEGEVHEEGEILLTVKTVVEHLPELEEILNDHHPYDVPECIVLEPEHVAASYRAWLTREVQKRP
jgi:uncharacterized protein involved in tolerance to divalent cations